MVGGGEVKLLFERLASGWSDKSSFTSYPKSNRYTFYQSTLDLFIKRYQHNLNENRGEKSEEINSINCPPFLSRG